MHEEFFRENIKNLNTFKNSLKGELTVVISSQEIKTKPINKEIIINKINKFLKRYLNYI